MELKSVIIETPAGSGQKFTYDPLNGRLRLKKALPAGMTFPFDFGFIPGTKGGDGDPLDVLVVSEFSTFPGCLIECRIVGGLVIRQSAAKKGSKLIRNDRFIAIPVTTLAYKNVNTLKDLPKELITQLESFFLNYIEQEGKQLTIEKRLTSVQAQTLIKQGEDKLDKTLLFEIFLPIKNDKGKPFPQRHFDSLREILVEKFGGVTLYQRSPVTGVWDNPEAAQEKDELIIYEVMADSGDEAFWTQLKVDLENKFKQVKIIIRSSSINIV